MSLESWGSSFGGRTGGDGRVGYVCGRWRLCSQDGRDVSASIGGCFVRNVFVLRA